MTNRYTVFKNEFGTGTSYAVGTPYVEILTRDGIAFSWFEGFVEDLKDRFQYDVTYQANGVDEAVWALQADDKKILVVYDLSEGIEIRPENKKAENDIAKMWMYFKDALEEPS